MIPLNLKRGSHVNSPFCSQGMLSRTNCFHTQTDSSVMEHLNRMYSSQIERISDGKTGRRSQCDTREVLLGSVHLGQEKICEHLFGSLTLSPSFAFVPAIPDGTEACFF